MSAGRPSDDSTFLADTTPAGGHVTRSELAPLAPGTAIDRYVLEGVLGIGGMGIVYRARDPELGRQVALKLVQPGAAFGSQGQARLLREAQVMARLAHPNTVTIFDVGVVDDRVFIAMELIDGVDMRTWLQQPRAWPDVLRVMQQAGRGLEAAHQAGLVHRDFKPANVLIGRDGRTRVLDLGLARSTVASPEALAETSPRAPAPLAHDALTQAGAILGTPLYMAPEQHLGKPVDARADQFSFCVTFHEALLGVHPFASETRAELVQRILRGEVHPPPRGRSAPRWLLRVVLRGLAPAEDRRFPTMTALLDELERSPRRVARTRVLAGGLALAGAGALAFALTRGDPPAEPPAPVASAPAPLFVGDVHRQVTFTGDAGDPRLSPDGRRLAFTSGDYPRKRVVVQELASGHTRTLSWWKTVWDLRWSPDGARLLVAGFDGVYVVPADGGERRHLTDPTWKVAWSGDGAAFAGLRRGDNKLFVFDLAAERERPLELDLPATLEGFDWSPDHDLLLLLARGDDAFSFWTVRPDGSELRRVHDDTTSVRADDPQWFGPHRFTYGRTRPAGADLAVFRVDPDSPAEELGTITTADDNESDYTFSRDRTRLAYTRIRPDRNLVRLDRAQDGTAATRRLTVGTQYRSSLAVSPDGDDLAFVMGPLWEADHIFVMPLAGGAPRRLTREPASLIELAWSPDGRELAYTENLGRKTRLLRIDVATGEARPIATADLRLDGDVRWAPARELLLGVQGDGYERLDPLTGEHRPFATEAAPDQIYRPIVSPDSARVVAMRSRVPLTSYSLWIFPLADGAPYKLTSDPLRPLGWSDAGTEVMAIDASFSAIFAVPLAGGEPRLHLETPRDLAIDWPVSIPGTTSFVTIAEADQTEIWLTGDLAADDVAAMATPDADPTLPPGHWTSPNSTPQNLDFEADDPDAPPTGWHLSEATRHRATATVTATRPASGRRALRLAPTARDAAHLLQYVPAAAYRGKRVRLRAALRSDDPGTSVTLWLLCEHPHITDTPQQSDPVTAGGRDVWTTRTVELDVPREAEWLTFGAKLTGPGAAFVDAFELTLVE